MLKFFLLLLDYSKSRKIINNINELLEKKVDGTLVKSDNHLCIALTLLEMNNLNIYSKSNIIKNLKKRDFNSCLHDIGFKTVINKYLSNDGLSSEQLKNVLNNLKLILSPAVFEQSFVLGFLNILIDDKVVYYLHDWTQKNTNPSVEEKREFDENLKTFLMGCINEKCDFLLKDKYIFSIYKEHNLMPLLVKMMRQKPEDEMLKKMLIFIERFAPSSIQIIESCIEHNVLKNKMPAFDTKKRANKL